MSDAKSDQNQIISASWQFKLNNFNLAEYYLYVFGTPISHAHTIDFYYSQQ